jgi:dTDP-4-dehydrorhamnose 3,5-epimerase
MRIEATSLPGVYILERQPFADERGSFTRIFCQRELEDAGLCGNIAQANLSTNVKKATLRGLHSQEGSAMEDKIVTCLAGSIFDVCVDVRINSPSFGCWVGATLSEDNGLGLYVPKGFAHGYLTLTDNASVLYFVTQFYAPGSEKGYRYDEPKFNIKWPLLPPYHISTKDERWDYL